MLRVANVSLSFGGIRALQDVTFDVEDGEVFGLIGPNGAGKTALLNCICGVYRPQEGSLHLGDNRLDQLPVERIPPLGLGRTFQSMDHFEEFKVADYVMLGRVGEMRTSATLAALRWPTVRRQEKAERRLVDETLERCGLTEHRNEMLSEVPYGTQKLIDIARVLCSGATWVLLDEPTSGTTSEDRPAISEAVDMLAEQATTIVVDHDVDFVARHVTSLVALDRGSVIASGPTQRVLEDPLVRQIYFGLVREDQVDSVESGEPMQEAAVTLTGSP
jgi:branched-chain amino acid transport system ATP-binding protein